MKIFPFFNKNKEELLVEFKQNEEAQLVELRKELAGLRAKVVAMNNKLDSILRFLYMEDSNQLPAPFNLTSQRFKVLSQNEEDGMILALFKRIGVKNRRFIDIGCGGTGGNSGFLAQDCGWKGLMVDGSPENIATIKSRFAGYSVVAVNEFVTQENINELLEKFGFTGEQDLLSIDIDGNDYYIWNTISVCSPRVVIMEYNWLFGAERAVTVPYKTDFSRKSVTVKGYHGASLAALDKLATRKGYRLIACEAAGVNAFFLRNDIEPSIPKVEPSLAYHRQNKFDRSDIYAEIKKAGYELLEIN